MVFNNLLGIEITFNPEVPKKPIDYYHGSGRNKGFSGSTKTHRYVPLVLGWTLRRSSGELKGNVSYARILNDMEIPDPDNYEIKHKITIDKDFFVSLNDHHIAIAPLKKTKAFKEKFCKSVVWSLMNDSECLKDKLREISGNQDKPIVVVESIPEKVKSLIPIIPAGFISWLNLTITEERCTA